ncbi:MAG: hypothetical protein CME65_10155 [Halobacteriovoraceae bacterium]|nr:hypothetical protein [Halobacteriovoraceae bacterium]
MHTRIGFLGGGQLASLLAQSASERGFQVTAFCDSIDDPITNLCQKVFVGKRDDRESLRHFFEQVDMVLLESEFFQADLLRSLSSETSTPVYPNIDDYERLYTKVGQKKLMDEIGVPYAKTTPLDQMSDFSSPHILKLSHGGYDGYGNNEVSNLSEALKVVGDLDQKLFFLEEKLNLTAEYACLLIKGKNQSYIYDPCETIQKDHKCLFVNDGPQIDESIKSQIRSYVERIDEKLEGPGIYAFEFFYDEKGRILFNEAAPRVHNSYHFSMESYTYSQFDMFINAVTSEELYLPERIYTHATMLNIVGVIKGDYQLKFPFNNELSPYKIHMYGKKESRPGRKLGHMTFFDNKDTFESAKWVEREHKL